MENDKPAAIDKCIAADADTAFVDISEFTLNSDYVSGGSSVDSGDEGTASENIKSSLWKDIEKVEPLSPEEVRWFYCSKKNQLKPLLGYDSIRLETEWRLYHDEHSSSSDIKKVSIRGGMYEADVVLKQCFPIYWSNASTDSNKPVGDPIIRGSWFFEISWQPLDEILSDRIEKEHLERWKGIDIKEISSLLPKGVMHSVQLDGCHVDWNSVNDVLLYKDATTHRAFRNIVQKFGVSKVTSGGYRLHRGYKSPSVIYDNHLPVSHLFFVVHGIGAKSDKRKVVRNTADFRCVCRRAKPTNFTERVEFIPVEWRSKLTLDGDMVESITPKKSQTIRSFVNNTAMDVLYYTSPLYRNDIVCGLRNELNRIYKHFMERNPSFDGKICVLAHSLGTVLLHDILTEWRPQYEIESKESHENTELTFRVDYLFCVGSPLGMFLCLRGHQLPSQRRGVLEDIIPTASCRRLFNVFHPADPVAYRVEPLILSHYKSIPPVQISSYHSVVKAQGSIQCATPSSLPSRDEISPTEEDNTEETNRPTPDPVENVDPEERSLQRKPSYLKSVSIAVAGGAARLSRGLWHRARKSSDAEDDENFSECVTRQEVDGEEENIPEATEKQLVERIDYELPEGFTESKLGYASLTSHTSYWNNQDLAMFVMGQLHSQATTL